MPRKGWIMVGWIFKFQNHAWCFLGWKVHLYFFSAPQKLKRHLMPSATPETLAEVHMQHGLSSIRNVFIDQPSSGVVVPEPICNCWQVPTNMPMCTLVGGWKDRDMLFFYSTFAKTCNPFILMRGTLTAWCLNFEPTSGTGCHLHSWNSVSLSLERECPMKSNLVPASPDYLAPSPGSPRGITWSDRPMGDPVDLVEGMVWLESNHSISRKH